MPYSDPEREKAFQAEYRKAGKEARKAYDRDYYLNVTKPKRLATKAAAKDLRPEKRHQAEAACDQGRGQGSPAREMGGLMPYKDPEDKRAHQRRRDDAQRAGLAGRAVDSRRLAVLRALLHTAQSRCNHNPCPDLRRERDRLQNAIDELVAGPELDRLRAIPHPAPLLTPLAFHAPEVPPEHAKAERPIWDWMAERYWTDDRRAMYRRARA